MLSENSQKNTVRSHLYIESRKQNQTTQTQNSEIQRTDWWVPEGKRVKRFKKYKFSVVK